jgi:Tetracyclin repressor-like, C-terminal domain
VVVPVNIWKRLGSHIFSSVKYSFFAATLESSADAFVRMGDAFSGGRQGLGRRLAETYFDLWESEPVRPELLSVLHSASTTEQARHVFVDAIEAGPLRTAQHELSADTGQRVPLAISQLIGVGFAHYVFGGTVIVSMTREQVAEAITPAIDTILG